MTFNSYIFILVFLPVSLAGYYILAGSRKQQMWWLLLSSAVFYVANGVFCLLYGIPEILINYAFYCAIKKQSIHRRIILTIAVVLNVAVLVLFKYTGFIVGILNALRFTNMAQPVISIPIGISFITFQQIAFLVDTYRNPEEEKESLLSYSVFISYFPHVLSGPIPLGKDFFPLLHENFTVHWSRISEGICFFAFGLAKKVLLSDSIALGVDYAFDNLSSVTSLDMLLVTVLYSLQLYFDFSGYTDMAVGIARMMGLDLPVNFNSPYKAENINDFWNRWHITLTKFLTHYVYIPLGGNRRGKCRTYINILIVFLVSGIWHGASYTFILWGFCHGVASVLHRIIKDRIKIPYLVGRVLTFMFVDFAWLIFRANSFHTLKLALTSFTHIHSDSIITPAIYTATLPKCISLWLPSDNLLLPVSLIFICLSFILTQAMPNSAELAVRKDHGIISAVIVLALLLLSVLSFSGVTHFIYAYF